MTAAESSPEHVVTVRTLADGNQSARCSCGEFRMFRINPRAMDLHASAHASRFRGRVEMGAA